MVVKGVSKFLKNNATLICGTVIILWAITSATILVVTNHSGAIRSALIAIAPVIPSLLTLLGINQRIKETKEEVQTVHKTITDGDNSDASP